MVALEDVKIDVGSESKTHSTNLQMSVAMMAHMEVADRFNRHHSGYGENAQRRRYARVAKAVATVPSESNSTMTTGTTGTAAATPTTAAPRGLVPLFRTPTGIRTAATRQVTTSQFRSGFFSNGIRAGRPDSRTGLGKSGNEWRHHLSSAVLRSARH